MQTRKLDFSELDLHQVAPIRSIGDYLSTKSRHLVIPPWQREYVWQTGENGEVGDLLEDLKEFLESGQEEYWLGPVILCEEPKKSGKYWLIDGQQRTLTLLIFAMVAKKYMTEYKLLEGSDPSHARILTLLCDSVSDASGAYFPRVTMDRGKADSILQTIFLWSGQPDDDKNRELLEPRDAWTQTQRNLANVAEWIYEEKFKKNWVQRHEFVESIGKLLSSVKLIELHLPNVQTALTVFDRNNNRGADLNSADLVKNRIFQYEDDEEFIRITEDWREMRSTLSESTLTRLRDPIFLLRALAINRQGEESIEIEEPLKKGKKITYNDLTDFWSNRLNPAKTSPKYKSITSKELVTQLLDGSRWLASLSKEKYKHKGDVELSDLYFSRYLKTVQHFPLLLAARHLDEQVFDLVARQVHARTVFYFLSGERTQEFENLVPEWAFELSSLPNDADKKIVDKIYSNYSITPQGFSDLFQAFSTWSYKDSSDRRKIRAVLAQLSRVIDKACGKELRGTPKSYFETAKRKSKDGWDIDHIEPKASDPRESIFQTIGNLVLLDPAANQSSGRKKPAEKIKNYANCPLYLTKTLVGVEATPYKRKIERFLDDLNLKQDFVLADWDEKQIKKRTKFYFEILKAHLTV